MQEIELLHTEVPISLKFLFHLSMWWRILYGLLRLVLGFAFLRLIGQPLTDFVYTLMSHEISGKAGDAVLEELYRLSEMGDFTITYFIALYFIFWGTVDIVLSLCLLRRIVIVFPITMVFIVLFIIYGIFRFTHTHSLILASIIILDVGILYLINNEYKKLQKKIITI